MRPSFHCEQSDAELSSLSSSERKKVSEQSVLVPKMVLFWSTKKTPKYTEVFVVKHKIEPLVQSVYSFASGLSVFLQNRAKLASCWHYPHIQHILPQHFVCSLYNFPQANSFKLFEQTWNKPIFSCFYFMTLVCNIHPCNSSIFVYHALLWDKFVQNNHEQW